MVDGLGRLEEEPDDVDEDLHEDEAAGEEQLRLRRDERRPLRRPLRRVEDTRDSERKKNKTFFGLRDMQGNLKRIFLRRSRTN